MRKIIIGLFCLAMSAGAVTLRKEFKFSPKDFEFTEMDNYLILTGRDMDLTDEPGCPQLPRVPIRVTLPTPARVKNVSVRATGLLELKSKGVIFPVQPPVILSKRNLTDQFCAPNPAVYSSFSPWPEKPWRWTGTGREKGNTVVDLVLFPVRYIGAESKLECYSRFEVTVDYEPLPAANRPVALGPAAFEYVIITAQEFDSIFARLAEWKTQKGVPAVIRHIDWVCSNFSGRDDAERLRNYLKTLPDSGVSWVLLGGDVGLIPFRKAFAMESEGYIHEREDSLPCDQYYADLDGDWDLNGNNVFGEVADSVDLYPELFVGRAPVNTASEVQGFVNKVLAYEKGTTPQRQKNALFFAEVMWYDPYTDGGRHKDKLEARSFSSGYTVTKLYQRLGNLSRSAVMSALRSGQNFSNHDGHGWIDVMSCGYSYLRTPDAETITNSYYGVLYSIGCWTTAFDYNSIGEAFVANPKGGTVATIGHSSYGWGSPGNPGFGYSDRFDDRFWFEVLNQGNQRIGSALANAKAFFVPFSRGENVYRWHQYQTNLMGDPEMPIWTKVPETLTVTAPAEIPVGSARILITVTNKGKPVANALVCLMQGNESYSKGKTNSAGQVWLTSNAENLENFTLTVTANNYLPDITTIPVTTGAFINLAGWEVNDSLGNNDRVPNPGEPLFLTVVIHNAGDSVAAPTSLILRAWDSVVVTDSIEVLSGGLAPQESIRLVNGFSVNIPASAQDGKLLRLELIDSANNRKFNPSLLVGCPELRIERYFWVQPPALPGEDKKLRVVVENQGWGWGHSVVGRINSLDGNLTVLGPESIIIGAVAPKSKSVPVDTFLVSIKLDCPGSYLAPVEFKLNCESYSFSDTLRLLIGEFGFFDDMENGPGQWSHEGTPDLWHLSSYRKRSGSYSWYCGEESNHRYLDNINCWLQTVPFMVAENCSLRFWRWFQVPNYGVDGIYLIIQRPTSAETLDFIGTGGALGGEVLGIESDWFEETYDLSWLPVGETIQVCFAFKSDGDGLRGEGFYIDDVAVTGGEGPAVILTTEPEKPIPVSLLVYPNPFRNHLQINLTGVLEKEITGAIYDISGRMVREVRLITNNGTANGSWNGADEAGNKVSAGVYFFTLRVSGRRLCQKVVLNAGKR